MSKVATRQQVIKDEADAEKRHLRDDEKDAVDAQRVTQDAQDAVRYRWLRNSVRNAYGDVNERLYVRCDERYLGLWALDGQRLDDALDEILAMPKAEAADAKS
jgi:hypothetical protein